MRASDFLKFLQYWRGSITHPGVAAAMHLVALAVPDREHVLVYELVETRAQTGGYLAVPEIHVLSLQGS